MNFQDRCFALAVKIFQFQFPNHFSFVLYFQDLIKLNQKCQESQISLLWAQIHAEKLSIYCSPSPTLIRDFQGENPRPENDLLLTQHIIEESGKLKISCTKKHFLSSGNEVKIVNLINEEVFRGTIEVLNDKEFSIDSTPIKCDETFIVKLMKRCSNDTNYLPVEESLKDHEAQNGDKIDENLNFYGILGSILGCEIYSSMVMKERLPLHQLNVDLTSTSSKKSGLKSVFILGQSVFSDCLKKLLKKSCQDLQIENMKCDEFLQTDLFDHENSLVICCGDTYEKRR